MEPSQNPRRLAVLVHTVLAASIGAYGVLLWLLRGKASALSSRPAPSARVVLLLAFVGLAQFAVAWWFGRAVLRSRRSNPSERVRRFFLMRGASAEAIGMYGLLAGFLRAPAAYTVALFAMSAAALLVTAPTRGAWDEALRVAESPGS